MKWGICTASAFCKYTWVYTSPPSLFKLMDESTRSVLCLLCLHTLMCVAELWPVLRYSDAAATDVRDKAYDDNTQKHKLEYSLDLFAQGKQALQLVSCPVSATHAL